MQRSGCCAVLSAGIQVCCSGTHSAATTYLVVVLLCTYLRVCTYAWWLAMGRAPPNPPRTFLQKGRIPAERGSGEEDKIKKGESRLSRERRRECTSEAGNRQWNIAVVVPVYM